MGGSKSSRAAYIASGGTTWSPSSQVPARRQTEKTGEKDMQIDLIFKVAAIGIIVAVLGQLLIRSGRE